MPLNDFVVVDEMRQWWVRLSCHPSRLLAAVCLLAVVSWLGLVLHMHFKSGCRGSIYQNYLCEQYRRGALTGKLCTAICDKNDISLSRCVDLKTGSNVGFQGPDIILKVDNQNYRRILQGVTSGVEFVENFDTNITTTMFRHILEKEIKDRLGSGDHQELVWYLMRTTDFNEDKQISLAEARSMWQLIQNPEFFILSVFRGSDFVPKFRGHCGGLYALESKPAQYTELFDRGERKYFKWLFKKHQLYSWPGWKSRAKMAVSLLELTSSVYQHPTQGMFYMCNVQGTNFAFTAENDVKLTDLTEIVSRHSLKQYFKKTHCSNNKDCQYAKQCQTTCDLDGGTCTDELVQPNLFHVCDLIEFFLEDRLLGNNVAAKDLRSLLKKCTKLASITDNSQIDHIMLLNDLKSLLFKESEK